MPPTTTSSSPSSSSLEHSSPEESPRSETPSFPFAAKDRRDALKQLSAALTQHLGSLSSTISGYADLLVDTNSPQERREIAMNVIEASTKIDDLLADLRYYSRPLEMTVRTVSVRGVVESAVNLLDGGSTERVRYKVEPHAARQIDADPRLLRQALFNLLQNAIEATSNEDEVLIRATLVTAESGSDPSVSFEVWNDGEIGLDNPADVFQPFFSTRAQRLGLGLPIACHIAEQHGGAVSLTANSATAGGTCFTLRV